MKVILSKDLSTLGEEGDVRDVARGYARNYLFPRGIAVPYSPKNVKIFEARTDEIEARKNQKRQDASGIKERLESLDLSITMPAGANGKLYGSVTSQTLVDELMKLGFQIERKRIELPGNSIKNAGKYKAVVRLYENSSANVQITIIGQAAKTETPQPQQARGQRRRREQDQPGAPAEQERLSVAAEQPAAEAAAGVPAVAVPATDTVITDTVGGNSQSQPPESSGE
jgi:large subunit ribosomal protein L9